MLRPALARDGDQRGRPLLGFSQGREMDAIPPVGRYNRKTLGMKKEKTRYICDICGHEEAKWAGKCPACLSWNSFSEISLLPGSKHNSSKKNSSAKKQAVSISEIASDKNTVILKDCGIEEINRVLGGGIVSGSVILIGGEPGIANQL